MLTGPPVRVQPLAVGRPGAPSVVFAHGLEDAWTSWLPLAAELDPSWRLAALDLPWRPGNDYRWRSRPAGHWLRDGLNLLDPAPDLLVAHSLGANAALELLCTLDPLPVRAVALVCPLYRRPSEPVTWRMFDRSRSTFVQHLRDGVRTRMGVRASGTDPAVLAAMTELALDRIGPAGFLAVFEQFVASAELPLARVELPTLVLAGGADPTLSRAAATALGGAIPGADVRFHEDYDHFCHVRHAGEVAVQLRDLAATAGAIPRKAGQLR